MKVRNKILIYFSSTVILLTAIAFIIIYLLFRLYREEEFQQRQKEKIVSTLNFMTEIEKANQELTEALDRISINSLLDEKLLIFDANRKLIYSSLDDVPVRYSNDLLKELNSIKDRIEMKDGKYDVVAVYITLKGKNYYGISKAYDQFGYSKLGFLRNTLLVAFFVIIAAVLIISVFLAKRISKPISDLARLLSNYRLGESHLPQQINTSTEEIKYLNEKFNELVKRTNEAFSFQKHSIDHISHQLKTPLAVLVSELERLKRTTSDNELKPELEKQINRTRSLAEVINALLEISKIEAGQLVEFRNIRVDEILFDNIEELNTLHPEFHFELNYYPDQPEAERLSLKINEMLIRHAFQNLLSNCVTYSNTPESKILIDCSSTQELKISISNSGNPLSTEEEKYLFNHFFRGENSRGQMGFGLGLVLAKKIINLHAGSISYSNPAADLNVFEIRFPLS
ncbi:MAG: HAMP domain-containing histidine kinase [Flavisolibacter sp.]|nr:HAMP domain-containing histidine kinase [Flavisolibacter sp.]